MHFHLSANDFIFSSVSPFIVLVINVECADRFYTCVQITHSHNVNDNKIINEAMSKLK